jgi:A/G-specific adenine glycosylase
VQLILRAVARHELHEADDRRQGDHSHDGRLERFQPLTATPPADDDRDGPADGQQDAGNGRVGERAMKLLHGDIMPRVGPRRCGQDIRAGTLHAMTHRTARPGADGAAIEPREIRDAILDWSATHGRSLPGREVREPWRVLVLEVMSQQTQFDRSLEAAAAFCRRFPDPATLAGAPASEAVRAWAGLGYNRRALALRAAAQRIVERHAGVVPDTIEALHELPGVGPYTARAVAARAFAAPVMPVDVNVRRVLGRVLGAGGPGARRSREIQALADAMAAADATAPADAATPGSTVAPAGAWARSPGSSGGIHPGDLADAVMDLAVAVCRPRRPDCPACPIAGRCLWLASGAALHEAPAIRSPRRPARGVTASPRGDAASGESRRGPLPFIGTRRWLRGQLLRELRDLPPGSWLVIEGDRGPHSHAAVRETVAVLRSEGFVELDPEGRARLSEG